MARARDPDHEDPFSALYAKQVPRPAKSAAKTAQITAQNRRRAYLERHPSYFEHPDQELADPILYERLIKRHQTIEERQDEGQIKGYGRVLEADLARGESRLSALAAEAADEQRSNEELMDPASRQTAQWKVHAVGLDHVWDEEATTREKGVELWQDYLRERFVQGGDDDFEYATVDENDEYDADARRDEQEDWFEDEEPSWDGGEAARGDTGVQDF